MQYSKQIHLYVIRKIFCIQLKTYIYYKPKLSCSILYIKIKNNNIFKKIQQQLSYKISVARYSVTPYSITFTIYYSLWLFYTTNCCHTTSHWKNRPHTSTESKQTRLINRWTSTYRPKGFFYDLCQTVRLRAHVTVV